MGHMIVSVHYGIVEWLCWIASAFKLVFWSDALPGVLFWLVLFLLFTLWIGSGFLAATIAEIAKRPRGEAFAMGLLMPWIYARNLAATVEIPPSEEEIAEAEAEALHAQFEEEEEEEPQEIDGYCRAWFSQIPVDDEGERVGPFRLTLLDGTVIPISVIRDLRDDLLVAENAATGKTLRIKYENVADFEDGE